MKNFAIAALCVIALAILGVRSGLVRIRYARMIDNHVLSNPVKVDRVDGSRILLSDGRAIELDDGPLDDRWSRLLKAGSEIEIDTSDGADYFPMWGNEPRFVCGGTAAFRIPLIPYDVAGNRRSLIGFGSFSEESKEAEQAVAPNRSAVPSLNSTPSVRDSED
jgi:hypothetical protein